jgi:RimJ/RimL family protein N-acetyltransferase
MDDARSVSSRPPESIDLGDVVVRRYMVTDAPLLHDAIVDSLDHLRPWMAWIAREPLEVSNRESLLADSWTAWEEGRDFMMGIFGEGALIGSTGLHLRGADGTAEIGYWMRVGHAGRGIATRVVRALMDAALDMEGIDTVAIHHDAANTASRRVAEKAGLSLVAEICREPEAPGETGQLLSWVRSRGR